MLAKVLARIDRLSASIGDLGPDYYERQHDIRRQIAHHFIRRQIAHHFGKLGSLGFEVTLCRLPEPDPDGTGPAQAA